MISPSLPMRNFSKFQAMSERATGDQSVTVVESKAPRGRMSASLSLHPLPLLSPLPSSKGMGLDSYIHLKTGSWPAPLTLVHAKSSPLNSKPLPGRTYFKVLTNSASFSFVW